jgi:hypothetical protein
MPRPTKRERQLKELGREKKRRKQEEEKPSPEEPHKEKVRNIGCNSDDDEGAVYTEMLLDEYGKAMEDVFEIFQNGMSEDDGQEHRAVTSRAAIDIERPKKFQPTCRNPQNPTKTVLLFQTHVLNTPIRNFEPLLILTGTYTLGAKLLSKGTCPTTKTRSEPPSPANFRRNLQNPPYSMNASVGSGISS